MDILYKEMRKLYVDFTPGEITRGLVAEMMLIVPDKELILQSIRDYVDERQGRKFAYEPWHDEWWTKRIRTAAASGAHLDDGDPGPLLMPIDDDEFQIQCR